MKFGRKARLTAAAAALLVVIGFGAQAIAGGKACTAGSKSGCSAASMGMCTGGASACTGMKAKNTSAAKTETAPMKAGAMFPEGTMVTAVEVPGGMDLLFTSKDLDAVQAVLKDHIAKCNNDKTCAGTTCNMTATNAGVTLAIRGADPHQCCLGLVSMDEAGGATGACCPGAKAKGSATSTSGKAASSTTAVKKS